MEYIPVKLPSGYEGKMRWYEDLNKRNERQKESNARSRENELLQRKKYFRPKYMSWIRKVPRGTTINIDEYVLPEKVRWLTPKESFVYDVKKFFKKIKEALKWLTGK